MRSLRRTAPNPTHEKNGAPFPFVKTRLRFPKNAFRSVDLVVALLILLVLLLVVFLVLAVLLVLLLIILLAHLYSPRNVVFLRPVRVTRVYYSQNTRRYAKISCEAHKNLIE